MTPIEEEDDTRVAQLALGDPLCPPQLVQVDGCNMWVMEETGGPSSDPPQKVCLQQKVHAQQSTPCSSERTAMSLGTTVEDVLGDQFSQTAEIVFGIKCCCRKVPHLATPASAKAKTLICQATKERQKCLNREQIWFVPVDSAKLVQLQVDGRNIWVMEETSDPSSDPPQTVHLQQKVHAQQSAPCSSERTAMSLGTTGDSPHSETLTGDGANDTILSQNVYDHREHLMLFRIHVSRTAAAKGRAVLEGVGLDTATIDICFKNHLQDVVEFVQAGQVEWSGGQGLQPPTWEVLLRAMKYTEIAQQHIQGLKTDLGLH